MKNQSGASGRMFEALGREGINIRAIAQGSSEKNVSAVVSTKYVNDAIRAIHSEFFYKSKPKLHIFICGYGNVGSALVKMLVKNKENISKRIGKDLIINGICNSKNYIISNNALLEDIAKIDIKRCQKTESTIGQEIDKYVKQSLSSSKLETKENYFDAIFKLKLSNSILIDCTANKEIANTYLKLFSNKISIVSCNKIANSLSLNYYSQLQNKATEEKLAYKYETTVGAALPIISTINQIINSGDTITKIQGILSGTLNYLFSSYNTKEPFANLVKKAVQLGYAEPDPRIDLGGIDVLRKFIILCRQAGEKIEGKDIDFNNFIPDKILAPEISDFKLYSTEFYKSLLEYETKIKGLYLSAQKENKALRFIVEYTSYYNEKKYNIELKAISKDHPFYNLQHTDNAVIITSDFYPNGIVIQGAGAGAKQTAQGLLNDIININ